jgi:hypothetical protein
MSRWLFAFCDGRSDRGVASQRFCFRARLRVNLILELERETDGIGIGVRPEESALIDINSVVLVLTGAFKYKDKMRVAPSDCKQPWKSFSMMDVPVFENGEDSEEFIRR